MPFLPTLNPYRIPDRGARDPAIRRMLTQEYLRREIPMTYSGQFADVMAGAIAASLGIWWIVALAAGRFVVDGASRIVMRRWERRLAAGEGTALPSHAGVFFYSTIGATWAMIAWGTFLDGESSEVRAVLAVVAITSLIVMSTSTCFVPRLFAANCIGFSLGLLPLVFVTDGLTRIVVLAAIPVLQGLAWELGRSTHEQYAGMLEAQLERDGALARQEHVIAELDRARAQASQLAATDSVTGLPNRQAFLDHVDGMIAREGAALTLVLLDLDYFKNINDTLGHHAGDAVLVATAQQLNTMGDGEGCLRPDLVARLGGDELALVFCGDCDDAELIARYAAWSRVLARLPVSDFGMLPISATGGSAQYPRDAGDRRALLNAADMALRSAKNARRGSLRPYHADMMQQFQRETDIADLLERSIGERLFTIHLQPQVDIATGAVISAEALTRFTHPGLTQYSVQMVFDVAEERGLGHRLSAALLEITGDAVRDLHVRIGEPLRVAINLSPSAVKAPETLHDQLLAWSAGGLPPGSITLEITEDAIAGRGLDHIAGTLGAIAGMGFALALDDFGTGHSSLAHLNDLPISELKIPKQFVQGVARDRKNQAIVRSAVAMCEHLGIRCVVEGVETDVQRDAIVELGARVGQGYRWWRPMTVDAFVEAWSDGQMAGTVVMGTPAA